ncbi:MAG: hypothetical protein [Caudoviricetes sp.]|nr:MAG: hypothetical protein [Caudoviricetes sp.]
MGQYHRVIDDLTEDELVKVHAYKESLAYQKESDIYTPSERLLGELGCEYGWGAVVMAQQGRIAFESIPGLLAAARSVRLQHRIELSEDINTAIAGAIGGKKGAQKFKEHLEALNKRL